VLPLLGTPRGEVRTSRLLAPPSTFGGPVHRYSTFLPNPEPEARGVDERSRSIASLRDLPFPPKSAPMEQVAALFASLTPFPAKSETSLHSSL